MLEIPFDADVGWMGLFQRFSTGEEGCYCEDCVVKNGGGHCVGYHVYGNGGNEEAIYEVVDEWYVLSFEPCAVAKDPFWDRPRKKSAVTGKKSAVIS
jgi:hypothetical protein